MNYSILNQILVYKKKWISYQEKKYPLSILKNQIHKSKRNFYQTLSYKNKKTIFILECKKSSPSTGIICQNFNPVRIAHVYKKYSHAISVLTDKKYFHGNFSVLNKISKIVTQPILCKDFFISEWQIYFARLHNADAILLMLSIINDSTYQKFSKIAHSLNMGILTEINNIHELNRAILLGAKIIGINNRNLNDFSIDIDRTIILSKKIPNKITIISESGINHYHQIRKLKNFVHGFLIGTTLMSKPKLITAINQLMLGENKICGITRIKDAYISQKLGAIYGGLIFIKTSPRYVHISIAKQIVSIVKYLKYVGVFRNANISYIIHIVNTLGLFAIQLHGTETQDYINILREKLPNTCSIWKSIDMNNNIFPLTLNMLHINRYILDNGGGSGKPFNWDLLNNIKLNQVLLAGGLNIKNCSKAAKLGCLGLDFNSGVETKPGIKNYYKLTKIFKELKNY